jgi:hypothetical protein
MKTALLSMLALATAVPAFCQQAPFTLIIRPEHDMVKAGEPVIIDVVKTNSSSTPLNLMPTNNPGEYYDIDITKDGVTAEPTPALRKLKDTAGHRITSFLLGTVKPGKLMKESVQVSESYEMSQPGAYTIQLHQNIGYARVTSNTVTVLVR